ncbi:MAG: SpoVR family protein [Gemmataceae bacterium]
MSITSYYDTKLPPDLRALKEEIEGYAREYGLDFYETIFEVIDADDLNEIASYGGFPTRYPHWSFGMQYQELKKSYDYGLSKIYEMVINNDPCYAYLMRCNHAVDQKLVMAHVYGHCDFFKNNAYFAHTTRKMMDETANHGARIRRYVEKYGEDEVEAFLDRCLSIDDLIDIHSTAIRRRADASRFDFRAPDDDTDPRGPTKFKSKDYMDEYINPREVLRAEEDARKKREAEAARQFPDQPEKDVLQFLIDYAPMKGWQRDVLSIIRDEAYYFMPQGMTKIMNEGWACVTSDTLIPTDAGLIRAKELVDSRRRAIVSDGDDRRAIYDWAKFADRDVVRIRTRRGYELGGSANHRLMLPDGSWRQLDQLAIGDTVRIARGADLWAMEPVQVAVAPKTRLTVEEVAAAAGVSMRTLYRHVQGDNTRSAARLRTFLQQYEAGRADSAFARTRIPAKLPAIVDERLAAFLGYLVGDGHISVIKRTIGLTTGDDTQADHFIALATELFGVAPRKLRDGNKWRVSFGSRLVQEYLQSLGLTTGRSARQKTVPDAILRSPKPVVVAFLRALFDCDGYAGKAGVILSTSSTQMSRVVQLLLLNFGILSSRRCHKDDCWHVHVMGRSAEQFLNDIGFGLERKQSRLRCYVSERRWFKAEDECDEVVSIEHDRADVYDFSIETTHRYAAGGFVNHNSYWHSTIMTNKALTPAEFIDYADHHSGTMAMSGGRLNPYKIGIELLRDIEERWNNGKFGKEWDECDNLEARQKWHRPTGLGRKKIFEVRKIHNDITFLDTFLTPEFCIRHKLFTYAWQEQYGQYFIESRDFNTIKERLLFSLTNFGKPWIFVTDGNYRNRGELLLQHRHQGVDLSLREAKDVLTNLQFIWSRPVHLRTILDDKPTLLSFDGTEHTSKPLGDSDDPRRFDL